MVLRKVKGILKKGAYAGLAAVILATSVQPAAVFAQDSAEPEETVETVVETEQTVSGNETDVETEESTLESTPEDTGEETAEEAGGTEEETETEAEILPGKTEGVKETEAVSAFSERAAEERTVTVTTLFYNSDGSLSTEFGGTSTYTRKDGTSWNVSTAIFKKGWILGPVTVEGMEDTNPADYKVEGVIDGSDVNITFVWYEDQTGPDGTSDKIPDQCQIEVTFAVENGTWNDGTSEPVTRFLTLTDAEGNPSVDGSAVAAVPEAGQFPAEGYTEGSWNPALKAAYTKADEGLTYVYSYAEIQPENPDTEKPNQDKTDTDAEKTSASGKTSETRQNQNTDTVRTGDSANAVLWGTMAAVAGAVLAGAAAGKYRKIKK